MNHVSISGIHKSVRPINTYLDQKLLFYNVDTIRGMSGSPIIIKERMVIGMHKFSSKKANNCKGARLITTDLVDRILDWNKAAKGTPFKIYYYKKG